MTLHLVLRFLVLSLAYSMSMQVQGITLDELSDTYASKINLHLGGYPDDVILDIPSLMLGIDQIIYKNPDMDPTAQLSDTAVEHIKMELNKFLEKSYLALEEKYDHFNTWTLNLDFLDLDDAIVDSETNFSIVGQKSPTSVINFGHQDTPQAKRLLEECRSLFNLCFLLQEQYESLLVQIKYNTPLLTIKKQLDAFLKINFATIAQDILNSQQNQNQDFPFQFNCIARMNQESHISIIHALTDKHFLLDRQARHLIDKIMLFTGKRTLHYLLPYVIAEAFQLASLNIASRIESSTLKITPAHDLDRLAEFYLKSKVLFFSEEFKEIYLAELKTYRSKKDTQRLEKALSHELLHSNYPSIF